MKQCVWCDSKIEFKTKTEFKRSKIIIHKSGYCKKCDTIIQESTEIPNDFIQSFKSDVLDFFESIKKQISIVILSFFITILTFYSVFIYLPKIDIERLNNVMSIILTSIIQGNIALIGLILVSITLAWNRAQNDLEKLDEIRESALDILCGKYTETPESTTIELAIKEYHKYCKENKEKSNRRIEKTFLLLLKLLKTVNYYKPSLCKRITCYKLTEEFLNKTASLTIPLYNDYKFFVCFDNLRNMLSFSEIPVIREMVDLYVKLDRDNKIGFKLNSISFYYNLTNNLFKWLLSSLLINIILSIYLLLSPTFSYLVFDIIIIVFAFTLLIIFKIILSIIDITY